MYQIWDGDLYLYSVADLVKISSNWKTLAQATCMKS